MTASVRVKLECGHTRTLDEPQRRRVLVLRDGSGRRRGSVVTAHK